MKNLDALTVEWVEPFGVKGSVLKLRCTANDAVKLMRTSHPGLYETDELAWDALDDFVVVNWATVFLDIL
jgi:hypothetical protein